LEDAAQIEAPNPGEGSHGIATSTTVTTGYDASSAPSLGSSPDLQFPTESGVDVEESISNVLDKTYLSNLAEDSQSDSVQTATPLSVIEKEKSPNLADRSPLSDPEENDGSESAEDSDGEGWITPSNLKKKQLEDSNLASTKSTEPKVMQAVSACALFIFEYASHEIGSDYD
jgi:RNA-binding protein NOB1